MASEGGGAVQFGNIYLGHRGGTSQGRLKITPSGLAWKRDGGGKTVDIPGTDIHGLYWSKTAQGYQLSVQRHQERLVQLTGFREKDLAGLRDAIAPLGHSIEEQELAVNGRNWGAAAVEGSTLVFSVGGKPAFRVPLKDVGGVQQAAQEVMLEFPMDDAASGEREDALVEMSFYVPKEADGFAGEGEDPSAKVFYDRVLEHTEAGAAAAGDAIVTFEGVAVLYPRGRFDIEMYGTFLKLLGQAQDFRIQYDSIMRLFLLPKNNTPHTLVAIALDPPIRKGQTYYHHVLVQFSKDEDISVALDIGDELLAAKNEKCGGKLQREFEGAAYKVFARMLRGLAATKLTKPGTFRCMDGDGEGHALRCSFKSDDGYLYPLERAFFYVHKPPTLLVHDEIESIEFMRQGGGVLAASAKTFDLLIRMRNNSDFLFRGIQKSEWANLFEFIQAKRLRVENLDEAAGGPGGGGHALDLGDDIDNGVARMEADGELDSEEEDEDFDERAAAAAAAAEEAEEEAEDDGDDEESPAKVKKAPKEKAPKAEKAPKEPKAPKPKAEPKKRKPAAAEGKAKKAKKDPNAPKKGLSAFMLFSKDNREKLKKDQPDLSFGDVGKELGKLWKEADEKTKEKYTAMAKKEKERADKEIAAYKAKQEGAAPKEEEEHEEEADDEEDDDEEE